MMTRFVYLSIVLLCSPAIIVAQTEDKNYTKTEVLKTEASAENSLLNNARKNSSGQTYKLNTFISSKPLSLGTYSSPYILKSDYPWVRNQGISLALFTSGSTYNGHTSLTEMIPYQINTGRLVDFLGSDISTYWDPGISVFSPNSKFSIDLYKKSSTQIFFSAPGKATPFLLNLHF